MPERTGVPRGALVSHMLGALQKYWPGKEALLASLPVTELSFPAVAGPLRLVRVALPDSNAAWGIDGALLVPREACSDPDRPAWREVDWWMAAFLLLEGWHERCWEQCHGPIHSYSYRLHGWDERAWERAWVNRIALFLRTWAGVPDHPLPKAELMLTHDVDAIAKTLPIRLKQSAFNLFNASRALASGRLGVAVARLNQAAQFLFGQADWWTLERILAEENQAGLRSQFNVFAGGLPPTIKGWLLDPAYRLSDPRLSPFFQKALDQGWTVGLHPGFDAWEKASVISAQRQTLERCLGRSVLACRQHWLRFSWQNTWAAQEAAGLRSDSTLMFNDRPGFRASAALKWHPWDCEGMGPRTLEVLPTIFMDSHFYDYKLMDEIERMLSMQHWVGETRSVAGEAALLWHPHTLAAEYGWGEGFSGLITLLVSGSERRNS